jgi:hypothetical protein
VKKHSELEYYNNIKNKNNNGKREEIVSENNIISNDKNQSKENKRDFQINQLLTFRDIEKYVEIFGKDRCDGLKISKKFWIVEIVRHPKVIYPESIFSMIQQDYSSIMKNVLKYG